MDELDLYIAKAMHRIEDLYNKTLGACYLSFSGGKDSTIILALIKMCEEAGTIPKNAIPAVYCDTKIELTATTDFVKWIKENWYGNVQIIKTEKLFPQVIQESGKPFRSKLKSHIIRYFQNDPESRTAKYLYDDTICKSNMMRLANRDFHILHKNFKIKIANECCNEMKKKPFEKYVADHQMEGNLTGMRAAEGGQRLFGYDKAIRNGKAPCTTIKKNGFIQKSPIIDWTDEICEQFVKKYNVPLSAAYTKYGMTRTGCFLCPYDQNIAERMRILKEYEPNRYKASLFYMKDVYIAQGVQLPFDPEYMREYEAAWQNYEVMRYEMLKKYRPCCKLVKQHEKKER